MQSHLQVFLYVLKYRLNLTIDLKIELTLDLISCKKLRTSLIFHTSIFLKKIYDKFRFQISYKTA